MHKMDYEALRADLAKQFAIPPPDMEVTNEIAIQIRGAQLGADFAVFALKEFERGIQDRADPRDLLIALTALAGSAVANIISRLSVREGVDLAAAHAEAKLYAVKAFSDLLFEDAGTVKAETVDLDHHFKDVGDA